MSNALNGWHFGERQIQERVGYAEASKASFHWVTSYMPEQHQVFYSRNLHFVPLTTLDAHGRPWVSLVTGAQGQPGFIRSPSETELTMHLQLWEGDPIVKNLELFDDTNSPEKRLLASGVGIEFSTRRRNKFAGFFTSVRKTGVLSRQLHMLVNQAIG